MTCQENCNTTQSIYELILQYGLEGLPGIIRLLLNEAMKLERSQYLGAKPYERSAHRKDYANGFKPKTLALKLGKLNLDIPQVREGDFYPSILEKGMRSERALKLAVAEMYTQGVSTRKVKKVMETLCGFNISSTEVSRASKQLDEQIETWRERSLDAYPYVYLDARYEHIRTDGHVRDASVLIAIGVNLEGKREVLGVSVSLSEAEVHWRDFLESLTNRGLKGIRLLISDAHSGLRAARRAVFPGIPWQRCQFHLQQNAQRYVPKQSMKYEVACAIRAIFNAPNLEEARRLLKQTITYYEPKAAKLVSWMEENIPEGFTVFSFSENHRRRIRTTNMVERLNQEIKRRTRVVGIFPNEASAIRLVASLLMETSEEWLLEEKRYLIFEKRDE